jgi:putative redox protein
MRATSIWKQDRQFDALSDSGHHVVMDGADAHTGGPSPMEAVLMALCVCSSIDVVSILKKKREPLISLTVSASAERAPEAPRVFTHIQLLYRVSGAVSEKAMIDAVGLSQNKYCSVSKMLEKTATIEFAIEHISSEAREGSKTDPTADRKIDL